jgi:hypothetical protein
VREYLQQQARLAERFPDRRSAILRDGFVRAAEHHCQRGEGLLYVAMLRSAIGCAPEETKLLLRLADAEWECGDKAQAIRRYRAVLEREPGHAERSRLIERIASDAP